MVSSYHLDRNWHLKLFGVPCFGSPWCSEVSLFAECNTKIYWKLTNWQTSPVWPSNGVKRTTSRIIHCRKRRAGGDKKKCSGIFSTNQEFKVRSSLSLVGILYIPKQRWHCWMREEVVKGSKQRHDHAVRNVLFVRSGWRGPWLAVEVAAIPTNMACGAQLPFLFGLVLFFLTSEDSIYWFVQIVLCVFRKNIRKRNQCFSLSRMLGLKCIFQGGRRKEEERTARNPSQKRNVGESTTRYQRITEGEALQKLSSGDWEEKKQRSSPNVTEQNWTERWLGALSRTFDNMECSSTILKTSDVCFCK